MKTKTAALIAVPGVVAVMLGGGVAAAAAHQPDVRGTQPQTTQVQTWDDCGSGLRVGTRATTRTTVTSPSPNQWCYNHAAVTTSPRSANGHATSVTRHTAVAQHTAVAVRGPASHQGWRDDHQGGSGYGDHQGGNGYGDHHNGSGYGDQHDGDCH